MSMETQCWICPYCYDDHGLEESCKEGHLKEQLKKARDKYHLEYEKNKQNLTDKEDAQREKHTIREELLDLRSKLKVAEEALERIVNDGPLPMAAYDLVSELKLNTKIAGKALRTIRGEE